MSTPVPVTPSFISPEELKQIHDVQNQFSVLTAKYGELYFQQRFIGEEMKNIDALMTELENKRVEVMTTLQGKYGTGTIDVNTGAFLASQTPVDAS